MVMMILSVATTTIKISIVIAVVVALEVVVNDGNVGGGGDRGGISGSNDTKL